MGKKSKTPDLIQHLAEALDKKGLTIKFGLEQQGHIEAIENILDDLGSNDYSWDKIAKEIGWCSKAARNHYINYLKEQVMKSHWNKVGDSLPDNTFLCVVKMHNQFASEVEYGTGIYDNGKWEAANNRGESYEVIEWMKIPE